MSSNARIVSYHPIHGGKMTPCAIDEFRRRTTSSTTYGGTISRVWMYDPSTGAERSAKQVFEDPLGYEYDTTPPVAEPDGYYLRRAVESRGSVKEVLYVADGVKIEENDKKTVTITYRDITGQQRAGAICGDLSWLRHLIREAKEKDRFKQEAASANRTSQKRRNEITSLCAQVAHMEKNNPSPVELRGMRLTIKSLSEGAMLDKTTIENQGAALRKQAAEITELKVRVQEAEALALRENDRTAALVRDIRDAPTVAVLACGDDPASLQEVIVRPKL